MTNKISVGGMDELHLFLHELQRCAEDTDSPTVLDSFSESYLLCYIARARQHLSAKEMLDKLTVAVHSRKRIHELESKMDKDYFVQLAVEKDTFMASGTEVGTNSPIFWIRVASLFNGCWALQEGSPKACAFIRTWVYIFERINAQTAHGPGKTFKLFMDLDGWGILDFNVALIVKGFSIMLDMFPCDNERIFFFGCGRVVSTFFSIAKTLLGDRMDKIHFIANRGEAEKRLNDSSHLPYYWNEHTLEGRPYCKEDRRNCWYFESVLTDDDSQKITLKDVLNPEPWPFPEFDYSQIKSPGLSIPREKENSTLETFEPCPDDDEW